MFDRMGALTVLIVAWALVGSVDLPRAEAQEAASDGTVQIGVTKGAEGGGSVEGATVHVYPYPRWKDRYDDKGKPVKDKIAKTDVKGTTALDFPPGQYELVISTGDGKKTTDRRFKIEKGKTTNLTLALDDMPVAMANELSVISRAERLEKEANAAAQKCDEAGYKKAKSELEVVRKDFAQQVDDIAKMLAEEAKASGLSDLDQVKGLPEAIAATRQAGLPVDPELEAMAAKLFPLIGELQNYERRLQDVDKRIKAVVPFDKNKCPEKGAATELKAPTEQPKSGEAPPAPPQSSPPTPPTPPATKGTAAMPQPAGVDACLVGTWRSQSATIPGPPGQSGGAGIVMTIGADGAESIDYTGMQPLRDSAGNTNLWAGTAKGQIAASNGTVSLKSVGSSALALTFTPAHGPVHTNAMSGLGPAGLGYNPIDHSYTCNATTLTFKYLAFLFTFNRQSGATREK
jgi:hypothetical protein